MTDGSGRGANWPDLAGRVEGRTHRYRVRIYHEDTDFSGAVCHANHLRFCARGRSGFLRLIGIHHSELRNAVRDGRPCGFVARRIAMDFLRPAMIDDLLEVRTGFNRVSGPRSDIVQKVMRASGTIFGADVTAALVGPDGRPARVPRGMLDLIRPYVADVAA